MLASRFLVLSAALLVVCPAIAHARSRPQRTCSTRSVGRSCAVRCCTPAFVAVGPSRVVPPLEPIEIQENYTVQVPVTEQVMGADGRPRTVTKMRSETRTRSRVLRTANEQIEYLKDRLVELDQQRVEPLERRVDVIEGVAP